MRPNAGVLGRQLRKHMTAACQLGNAGQPYTDPETGEVVRPFDVLWSGPCLVRPERRAIIQQVVGGEVMGIKRYAVLVPVGTPRDANRVRVTSSGDPDLVGQELVIEEDPFDDWQAVRTMVCTFAE